MILSPGDLQGVYAIIPTPALPGAERFDAADGSGTVDLDETARLVERLLADGVDGLIALGTTGECATLTAGDYEAFADCVLATVGGRVPTFIGATALGGHEVARRLRFLQERGADGTLLGMPMWQPLTTEMAVEYYGAVSDAFPDLSVMVYANARAFRYGFPPEFWAAVTRRAATVMSAKFSDPARLEACLRASGERVNFVPIDMRAHEFAGISPSTTTACWATAAAMGPEPCLALMDAIAAGEADRVMVVAADIAWANEPIEPLLASPDVFASYNIQIEKVRMESAGYCRPGPIRPPYNVLPDEYAEAARECGRRWSALCRRYGPVPAGSGDRAATPGAGEEQS